MSTTFDRSKFKATQAATMKQSDKETEAVSKNRDTVSADYMDIKVDGTNKYRIYPFHPDGGGNLFAETKVVHWLEVEVPERDENKNIIKDASGKVKMKLARRPIYNSKIHGGTPKDIIEEYIKFAEKIAKDNNPTDEKAQKSFLEPIHGSPYGVKNGKSSILSKQSWVMYVDKINPDGSKTFGRIDIGKAIKQRLNAIAASEATNEPLGTDPFTDPNDGRAIMITYNSKAQRSQDYYITEIDSSFDKKTQKINLYPLSDADLEKFMKYPSLASMFKNVYKKKDFEMALNGLKILDEKENIGVFAYDEFLDIAEEISSYYADDSDNQNSNNPSKSEANEPIKTNTDAFDDMDRDELKAFAKENKTGIIIVNKYTDDEVRDKIREWYNKNTSEPTEETLPTSVKNMPEDLPWEQDEKKEAEIIAKASAKDKIAALRSKLGK